MRVALLVGVLMVNTIAAFYQVGWLNLMGPSPSSSQAASGQVKTMDDAWPPPPPPPSFP